MNLGPELIEELKLLQRISQNPSAEGISISAAGDPAVVAAAERLFEKGIISLSDGGHLTDSGREAAEHMNRLFNQLSPPLEPI
jgi:uncharacterized protein (TIGR02647 family)